MTKNEEENVRDAIVSASRLGDVFVVDSGSTDGTAQIAAEMGAHVVPFEWNGRYPKKKQWILENLPTACDWIMLLDADERISNELVAEIREHQAGAAGLRVRVEYWFAGERVSHSRPTYKIACSRRALTSYPEVGDLEVPGSWEVEGHYQPRVKGRVVTLKAPLQHKDNDLLVDWFARHNRYSDWEAWSWWLLGHEATGLTGSGNLKRIWLRLPMRGVISFFLDFFVYRGFRDGWSGFDYAAARFFFQWQIAAKRRELKRRRP